uniref:Carbohydrate deacetylase n=1 Tax=Echinococcus granulosus TaxID=6210 RepID=A0A068WNF0_ECHGR|nr:YdjC protein [Echinococcus granulosus]
MNGGVVRSSTTPATSVLLNYCMQEAALPGLHINLSEGEPLSTKGSISSLLEDGTGLFYGKANLRRNLQTVHLWHVEIEIERQIIKFEKLFGVSPLRVDGHQHCHVLPGIVEVLCRLLPRHSVSWIRLPEEAVLKQRDSQMLFSRMNLAVSMLYQFLALSSRAPNSVLKTQNDDTRMEILVCELVHELTYVLESYHDPKR